ncbi:phenylalanine-4-hydroxylase [Actimicrobium sp. GrIS 1.19]|uniref:phenylalanine 4-monooxygenase n=1 Tax=Actimicrobium sp. GrIS 1.19 TaxID=3071708 RepID=UPI002E088E14|nr:phenylalanine-4-hydroxylase [Actimicrobium sp. GrIS 1.19]
MGAMESPAGQAEFLKTLEEKSSGGKLRGDYSRADAQYVVKQQWDGYTDAQHELWRRLYERQARLLPGLACEVFIDSLKKMDASRGIPDLEKISAQLVQATGWTLVAVPGLVPDLTFFEHLANCRFPVTVWLREPEEFDYIVEPDIFHDFFGHVPLLFNPIFANHMQEYGKGGLKAMTLDGLTELGRLYWYTVEFGLMHTPQGLRAYGAGILSSGGEIVHCLTSPEPHRLPFNVERVMRTRYKIDSYQETYFVIDSFEQLFTDTAPDFTPIYARLHSVDALPANALLAGETDLPL